MKQQPRSIVEFYKQHNYRVALVTILCIGLLVVLMARMYYMQVMQYQFFKNEADDNRIQVKFIPPIRGKVFDRNGTVLASNSLVYDLAIVVEYTKSLDETLERINRLVPLLKGDLERFKYNRRYARAYEPVVLKTRLNETDLTKIEVNLYHLTGATILTRHDRYYAYPKEFAHVIGYVGGISTKEFKTVDSKNYNLNSLVGKIGIEKQYEDSLHGIAGTRKIETDAQGQILRVLSVNQAQAGTDIYLSIDAELQQYAYQLMKEKRGSLVAIDPNTFEILAMVSTPSYDSSLFINGISHKDYNQLRNSIDRPLFNRSLSGRYPAGSTFKPFLALAGLENNTINEKQSIHCIGYYQLKGVNHKFRDWKKEGHAHTNLNKAIAESCDTYFFDLAFKLGIDNIHPYLGLFGFGALTGIDLPYEVSGFIPSREWKSKRKKSKWQIGETLNVGIGQGLVQVSPLQLAQATAILANRGVYYQPKLLHRKQYADGQIEMSPKGVEKKVPVVDDDNWNTVIRGMKNVVHSNNGTARLIADYRYSIAGKTGTAQVITIGQDETYNEEELDERKHDHALFIAFAPVKEPKIAIAVIVENGKHGGSTAAPIAKKTMDKYLFSILQKKQKKINNQKKIRVP